MSRQTGSVKFHNTLYPYLAENGPLNTHQIYDWMNNRKVLYKNGPNSSWTRRTSESYSIQQVSQILRTSKWFKKVGVTRSKTSRNNRAEVYVYDVNPLEEVVAKIVSIKHHYQDPEKTMPKFAKELYNKMMEEKANATP